MIFGAICMGIAVIHIGMGQRAIPGGLYINPTMDSEDRFYATLFLGFGAALVWTARDLGGRRRAFLALLAVFFLGGLARVVSAVQVGLPNTLFQILGGIELLLPPLLWWMHARAFPLRIDHANNTDPLSR